MVTRALKAPRLHEKGQDSTPRQTGEVWMLEETLESPWTARRSNQSILKEINSEYLLEGLKLKDWPPDAKN